MIPRSSLALTVAAALAWGVVGASSQTQPPPPRPPAQAGQVGKLPEERSEAQKRRRVVSDLSGFELLDAARLKKKPMVAGAGRGLPDAKPPNVLAPYLTRLYGSTPVFQWQANVKGQRCSFVLRDSEQKELHRAETADAFYSWPAGAVRLGDGQVYYWTVQSVLPSGASSPAPHGLQVVTTQERIEIDKALRSAMGASGYQVGLARAQVFTDQRLWYDAIEAYTDLIAHTPDRAEAYERRGMIYAQIPATQALAEADFTLADKLTGQ